MNGLQKVEFNGTLVLTTQQIAEAYETDTKIIQKNFSRNKERYIEGKHFICLEGEELKEFKTKRHFDDSSRLNKLYLWTQKGAFLHAKSLNTDKAWDVYDALVDEYFQKRNELALSGISKELQAVIVVDKRVTQVEKKVDIVRQELERLEFDLPILPIEADRITEAVRKRGVDILGGKGSNAYQDRSMRQRVYSNIYADLKANFRVRSYKSIKRNQCDSALNVIARYDAPLYLQDEIYMINGQRSIWDD
ncbi:MAG: hypothetical protein DBX48_03595 [Limosilactobacillus fermentum]|jgi:anti-repressor|nr:MAG: hypothetical protein DBX48_03280 [Limosilactobacillus fermentum]PWM27505.1 MAG: hypothetical protein DBX48_03595 [Limosilactobacillus fermentum]